MDLAEFWKPYVGAVSLTFDDGLPCQREKAIPAMDALGIQGTFYLCPRGDDWRERLRPWAEVARNGHEIGNHSISHTCSNNFGGGHGGLEDKSLADIEADLLAAQKRLAQLAPHQVDWTFCYPCYQTHVGRGVAQKSYVPIVAKHCLAGRARGEYGFANHPAAVDLACAWAIPTERMGGFEMIGLVEELTAQGRWVIFVFHEIDGARLTVGSYDFGLLLRYLHRRRDKVWTAPVAQVARRIADRQKMNWEGTS
jgi:hypothetical protein